MGESTKNRRRLGLLSACLALALAAAAETVTVADAFEAACPVRYGDAFSLSWTNLGANASVLVFTTDDSSSETADLLWAETFSNATASASGSALTLEKFASSYADHGGLGWIPDGVYPSPEAGSVRLGTTEKKGSLVLPPLGELTDATENLHLRVRLRDVERENNQTRTVPFYLCDVADDGSTVAQTNDWATFSATTNWTTCVADVPSGLGDRRMMLHSFLETQAGRTLIDSIELLSGEMTTKTNVVKELDAGTATDCVLTGMPRELLTVVVTCTAPGDPSTNFVSSPLAVDLRESAGPTHWLVSSFTGLVYGAALEELDDIVSRTPWRNLDTIPGFGAHVDGAAADCIRYDSGSSTIGGIYATHGDGVRFLSLLATEDKSVDVLLHVANDTDRAVGSFALGYDASQSTFPADAPEATALECSYRVFADPFAVALEGDWTDLPACAHAAAAEAPEGSAVASEGKSSGEVACTVEPGEVLVLRWRVASGESHRPMLGLGNPVVRLAHKDGLVLSLR